MRSSTWKMCTFAHGTSRELSMRNITQGVRPPLIASVKGRAPRQRPALLRRSNSAARRATESMSVNTWSLIPGASPRDHLVLAQCRIRREKVEPRRQTQPPLPLLSSGLPIRRQAQSHPRLGRPHVPGSYSRTGAFIVRSEMSARPPRRSPSGQRASRLRPGRHPVPVHTRPARRRPAAGLRPVRDRSPIILSAASMVVTPNASVWRRMISQAEVIRQRRRVGEQEGG